MYIQNVSFKLSKYSPYFFKNLSFSLEKGKIHALQGKNGIGKSVLLGILSKKMPPQAILEGEISREKAFLVNQRYDWMVADQFSFHENLRFATMESYPRPFAFLQEGDDYSSLLEKFHINPQVPVYRLSGGQRQILALLMVLQKKPQFLLLDEPTATLDEENATMVFDFLKALSEEKGLTFLVVCHDRDLLNTYTTGQKLFLEMADNGLRKVTVV
jgi:ABC-type multidrug transport system ATPase subunit